MSQSELWALKPPRTTISERGDCKVMVSIDSDDSFVLGERYGVQVYFIA